MSKRFFEIIEGDSVTYLVVAASPTAAFGVLASAGVDLAADVEPEADGIKFMLSEISEDSAEVIRVTPDKPGDPQYLGMYPIGSFFSTEN